jgi:TATA-box binding protein (TBP) (component of TFIID and TFIIIB)
MIFKNGRIITNGTKTIEDAKLALRLIAKIVQKTGVVAITKCVNMKVMNIMGLIDLKVPIRLTVFHNAQLNEEVEKRIGRCTYEPEVFPGVIFSLNDGPAVDRHKEKQKYYMTALIFVSGKITIFGAKDVEDIEAIVDDLRDLVWPYRKGGEIPDDDVPDASQFFS